MAFLNIDDTGTVGDALRRGIMNEVSRHPARPRDRANSPPSITAQTGKLDRLLGNEPLANLGVTVRRTIDTVIATRCIESGYALLRDDRDFQPFFEHLGLRVVD